MLCKAPFINMYWRGNRSKDQQYSGMWRSCCESMGQDHAFNAPQGATFEEIWNNAKALEIRKYMREDRWHPNCRVCKEKEDKVGVSARAKYNALPFEDFAMIDYRPSNLCNLKCRMCSSFHSSLLAMEGTDESRIFDKKSNKDQMIDKIDWSKMKSVKLLGGEPFIMEETLDVLDRVTEDCQLNITTNAYIMSKDILKAVVNAKCKIQINLSIDGVRGNYDYIRVNSDWNKVQANIRELKSYNKFDMSINPVGMIWNAFGLIDLFDWAEQEGIRIGNAHWVGQDWNRLGLLSDEHKEQIKHPKLNHLLTEEFSNRDELLNKWKDETNKLDLKRGTDIISVDERYVDYL